MLLPSEQVVQQQAEAAAMAVAALQWQQQLRHKQQLRAEASRRVFMTRNGLKVTACPFLTGLQRAAAGSSAMHLAVIRG